LNYNLYRLVFADVSVSAAAFLWTTVHQMSLRCQRHCHEISANWSKSVVF